MRVENQFNNKLEGLRGLCAISVAIAHFFSFNFFGAQYTSVYPTAMHIQFSHVAVLIFFIISGYVIGISHINEAFNAVNIIIYLKKRLVRLYPIYLVALFISFGLNFQAFSPQQFFGHLFFLQVFAVKVVSTNPSLWSLSFEFGYYLLYVLLWYFNKNFKNVISLIGIVFIGCIASGDNFLILKSFLLGWEFWLFGLYIAYLKQQPAHDKIKPTSLISSFLILLATLNLESPALVMRFLHINIIHENFILTDDIVYLPVCLIIVLVITKTHLKAFNLLQFTALLIPGFTLGIILYFHKDIMSDINWAYGTIYFVLAVVSSGVRYNIQFFEKLNLVGKISYAIYVFHFPIGYILSLCFTEFLKGKFLLIMGFLSWVILTFSISYIFEILLQPRIKKYFLSKLSNPIVSGTYN